MDSCNSVQCNHYTYSASALAVSQWELESWALTSQNVGWWLDEQGSEGQYYDGPRRSKLLYRI